MLYKVFIDDSGGKDYRVPYSAEFIKSPPSLDKYRDFWLANYFVLCGVRIKQDDLKTINKEINDLKQQYFGTHRVEIKSVWLRNSHQRKKHYTRPFGISDEKIKEFSNKFVDLIANYRQELRLFATVFDKRCFGDAKRKQGEGNPLLKSAQVLFERLQYAGNYNVVIFDQMESSLQLSAGQHGRILSVLKENQGMKNIHVNKYSHIADIKFMQSCNQNFLQVADVCAYNIFRQFVEFGREWTLKGRSRGGEKILHTYPYFEKIRCNFFHQSSTNKVSGVGLTCIPDVAKANWNLLEGCNE